MTEPAYLIWTLGAFHWKLIGTSVAFPEYGGEF